MFHSPISAAEKRALPLVYNRSRESTCDQIYSENHGSLSDLRAGASRPIADRHDVRQAGNIRSIRNTCVT